MRGRIKLAGAVILISSVATTAAIISIDSFRISASCIQPSPNHESKWSGRAHESGSQSKNNSSFSQGTDFDKPKSAIDQGKPRNECQPIWYAAVTWLFSDLKITDIALVILSAITACFIAQQVTIYRQQATIMKAQTALIRRQARTSDRQIEAIERLERPLLLVIPPLGQIGYKSSKTAGTFPMFDLNFRNYGRSPAIVDCWHIGLVVSTHPPDREPWNAGFFYAKSRGAGYDVVLYEKMVPTASTVAPGGHLGSVDIKEKTLLPGQVARLKTGEQKLWVDGLMLYVDVFGRQRETHFRWIYDTGLDFFRMDGGKEFNRYT